MNMVGPLFISAQDSLLLADWSDAIEAVEATYSSKIDPAMSPLRTVARGDGVWLRTLPAILPSGTYMGLKIINLGRDRGRTYLIALVDQRSGELVSLLDGSMITALRTAATSALSVKRLANPDARVVGVLGSGNEAQSHARAVRAVMDIGELRVYSPTPQRREQFASSFQTETAVPSYAVNSPEEAIRDADVVVAAARSYNEQPILLGKWLKSGVHVISVGSTLPEQREVDVDTLDVADIIVVDVREEVMEDTGDLLAATEAGVSVEHKVYSLNDVLVGKAPGRSDESQITLFKSVGAGMQDITVAEMIYQKATKAGVGKTLPLDLDVLRR